MNKDVKKMKFKLSGVVSKFRSTENENSIVINGDRKIKEQNGTDVVEKNIWISVDGTFAIILNKEERLSIDVKNAICPNCKSTFTLEIDVEDVKKIFSDSKSNPNLKSAKIIEVEFSNEN